MDADDDLRGEGPVRREHRRKTLTYQRDVHSIDSSLDENNYDMFDIPAENIMVSGYAPDKADNNKKNLFLLYRV